MSKSNPKTYVVILLSYACILALMLFFHIQEKKNYIQIPVNMYLYETKMHEDVRWAGDNIVRQQCFQFEFRTKIKKNEK